MNQKEYELIARTLAGWYNVYNVTFLQYDGLITHMADRLAINYSNFDRAKFEQLCMENMKHER